MRPLLRLSSVTKSFGSVQALKGVSFELLPGEVHALLGENGAGKSTLIKVITGAHQPDTGGIEIAGQAQAAHSLDPGSAHRLGVACIYQHPTLFPDLTVAENIALRLDRPAAWRRVRWPDRKARSEELLRRIGAAIQPDSEVSSLSMPEQQLVEIACALGAGARIIIMDEPTSSLTRKEQDLLFGIIRDLRDQGAGVIYISHRLDEIFALADRITILRDGESVGTFERHEIDEASAIRRMVGRELSTIYPPRGPAAEGVLSSGERNCGPALVALRDLSCDAGGIHQVTLDVRAGEILGLAGLVGAGRTELARTLFGLTPADSGEVLLGGESVMIRSPEEAIAHGIGYLPEDRLRHGVILEMPIAANITMAILPRLFRGAWLRFAAERELALEFIRSLGVRATGPDAVVGSLSGGNQQKIALARWLATKPRFLILDEPTQGVDVGAKSEIHKIIRGLANQGLAVLMISSDLPEILGMSDRIAVMRSGTISQILPFGCGPHDVMAAALGQTNAATLP